MGDDNYNFSVLSFNVRGLNDLRKRTSIFTWLQKQADIIFLQETYSSKESETLWANEWGGKVLYAHGSKHSRGVMILFKKELDFDIQSVKCDYNGRFILARVLIQDTPFTLLNVYMPNNVPNQVSLFNDINKVLIKFEVSPNDKLICGGDWNVVLDPSIDKKGGNMVPKERTLGKIDSFVTTYYLHDVWRVKHPTTSRYTWRQKTPLIQCRIDYWLTSEALYDCIESVKITPGVHSDHSAIYVKFCSLPLEERGRSFWRFNAALLQDDEYVTLIENGIPEWYGEVEELEDKRVAWDFLKYCIRKESITYSKKKARQRRSEEDKLRKQLETLEANLAETPSQTGLTQAELTKNKLEKMEKEKAEGLIIRSRARWYESGEKSSKFFLGLEQRNSVQKHVKRVTTSQGETITNPEAIRTEQVSFYKELYRTRDTDLDTEEAQLFFGNQNIPKLTEVEKSHCEGLITEAECLNILASFKENKSPGNDGLTIEFYRKFWSSFAKYLVESVNYSHKYGEMSISQRQAVITLLDKKGKDRSLLKNWRPISLLNVDYKIVTKVIATRMKTVLPSIIHHSQSGYVDGRFIGESVRTIADIIEFTKVKNITGILLLIDFEKAFDSLEWNYLQKALETFNFGPSFRKWIQTFYKNITSCIVNNGHASNYFTLERGVRQGDPLSPYLFITSLELLAIAVRQNDRIKGIDIDGQELKLALFADDMSSFLADVASGEELLELLSKFESCAGLRINRDKTEAMWLGSARHCNDKPLGVKWPTGPIKALGVYFSYDDTLCESYNFDDKIKSLEGLLKVWRMRNLTVAGKITILKTFGLSKFMYLASLISIPKPVVQKINRLAFAFVWNNHPDKVKRSILINTYENGGKQMMDFETMIKSLQLSWIKRFVSGENRQWKHVLSWLLKPVGGVLLLQCNCLNMLKSLKLSHFYKEALEVWLKLNQKNKKVCHEIVWNNDKIKIGGKTVIWADFLQCGFKYVIDFFNAEGKLLTFVEAVGKGVKPTDFLKWNGLISAFPREWKQLIKDVKENDACMCHVGEDLVYVHVNKHHHLTETKSKNIYLALLEEKATVKDQTRMNEEYDIEPSEWKHLYLLPRKVLIDERSREFQYKFLQNYVCTNVKLYQMKLVNNNMCSLCQQHAETVEHLFVNCVQVKSFWSNFKDWWCKTYEQLIVLTSSVILLGHNPRNPNVALNHLLIIAKQYIYWCRLNNRKLNFPEYSRRVHYVSQMEKMLAKTLKGKRRFNLKWKYILKEEELFVVN
jgi:exonuclease III